MSRFTRRRSGGEERHDVSNMSDLAAYYADLESLHYGGSTYNGVSMTMSGRKGETLTADAAGHRSALKASSILWAAVSLHVRVFSQAEFAFQRLGGGPTDLFGTAALLPLEKPWPNATTQELLAKRCMDVDLAGNSYIVRQSGRLRWLQPDRVSLAIQSESDPGHPESASDAEVVGYWYTPSHAGALTEWFDVHEVSHWSPFPDPDRQFVGMSPITPVLRELGIDRALTTYKKSFIENAATPNLAVSPKAPMTGEQAREFMDLLNKSSAGARKAGRTLFLNGADVTVVGADFKALDVKGVQGALESRLAAALGVPAGLVGFSEGMASNTYSNLDQSRRILTDTTLHFLWRSICAASSHLVTVPADARLWYDSRDIPFLQDDADRAATIHASEAQTIRTLTDGGFDPVSVVNAVKGGGDWSALQHTGLMSVQLMPPGTGDATPAA